MGKKKRKNQAKRRNKKTKRGKRGSKKQKNNKKKQKYNKKKLAKRNRKRANKNKRKRNKKQKLNKKKKARKNSKKPKKNNKSKNGNKKQKKRRNRKGQGKGKSSRATTCGNLIAQLGQNLPQALAWIQQGKRLNTNIKSKSSKGKKKGDFMSQYESGVATAGGDKAKPKCNGKELGNSDNFTVALNTLKNCSESIKAACEVEVPKDLVANVKKCNDLAEKYRVDFRQQLVKATEKTICANAKTLNESWATVVKACEADAQVATAEAAQLKEKRACIKAFGACRKQERALPSQMNNCMPKCNNAGGSTTPASSASSKNLENAKKN